MNNPHRLKKHYFTLLELLISLVLAVALLTTLTYFYRQVSWLDVESEKIQKENFQLRYLENRLAKIFPNVLAEHDLKKKEFHFFTSGDLGGLLATGNPSLVFMFDNGASLDTKKANHLLARLYVDKEHRLCLATWPAPARWDQEGKLAPPPQKEILIDNIESLSFLFFIAPERDRSLIKENLSSNETPSLEQSQDTKGEWVSEWNRSYEYLPSMIKIIISRKLINHEKPVITTYAFPLAHSQKLIIYEQ